MAKKPPKDERVTADQVENTAEVSSSLEAVKKSRAMLDVSTAGGPFPPSDYSSLAPSENELQEIDTLEKTVASNLEDAGFRKTVLEADAAVAAGRKIELTGALLKRYKDHATTRESLALLRGKHEKYYALGAIASRVAPTARVLPNISVARTPSKQPVQSMKVYDKRTRPKVMTPGTMYPEVFPFTEALPQYRPDSVIADPLNWQARNEEMSASIKVQTGAISVASKQRQTGDTGGRYSDLHNPFPMYSYIQPYENAWQTLTQHQQKLAFTELTFDGRALMNFQLQITGITDVSEAFAEGFAMLSLDDKEEVLQAVRDGTALRHFCNEIFGGQHNRYAYTGNPMLLQEFILQTIQTAYPSLVGKPDAVRVLGIIFFTVLNELGLMVHQDEMHLIVRSPSLHLNATLLLEIGHRQEIQAVMKNRPQNWRRHVPQVAGRRFNCAQLTEDVTKYMEEVSNALSRVSLVTHELHSAAAMFMLALHPLDRQALPPEVRQHDVYDMIKRDYTLWHTIMTLNLQFSSSFSTYIPTAAGERERCLDRLRSVMSDPRLKKVPLQDYLSTLEVFHHRNPRSGFLEGMTIESAYSREREHQAYYPTAMQSHGVGTSAGKVPHPIRQVVDRTMYQPAPHATAILNALDRDPLRLGSSERRNQIIEQLVALRVGPLMAEQEKRFFCLNLSPEPDLIHIAALYYASEAYIIWKPLLEHDVAKIPGSAVQTPIQKASIDSFHLPGAMTDIMAKARSRGSEIEVYYNVDVQPRNDIVAQLDPAWNLVTTDPRVVLFHSVDKAATTSIARPPNTLYRMDPSLVFAAPIKTLTELGNMAAKVYATIRTTQPDGSMSPIRFISFGADLQKLLGVYDRRIVTTTQEAQNHQQMLDLMIDLLPFTEEFYCFLTGKDSFIDVPTAELRTIEYSTRELLYTYIEELLKAGATSSTMSLFSVIYQELSRQNILGGDYRAMFPRSMTTLSLRQMVGMFHLAALRKIPELWLEQLIYLGTSENVSLRFLHTPHATFGGQDVSA